jgi:hypothetical protein
VLVLPTDLKGFHLGDHVLAESCRHAELHTRPMFAY